MQRFLFDDPMMKPRGLVAIAGSARTLTPAQKKFNQLLERINRQRQELAEWRTFGQVYHQQLAEHCQPALARLRDKQINMAQLLDRILDGKALDRKERAKARDMLSHLLSELLLESQDPQLVRLHDKYAERSFSEERQEHLDIMRTLASEELGVDIDAIPGDESPDELAEWLNEQLRARSEQPRRVPPRKKSAKTIAREAQLEQAAQAGSRAVREVFRKLASELHPDRETDPGEHARKTDLMQRVNQAYKAGDLLALLELQLSIEQIDPAALAGLAEERLRQYVHVLEGQSRRLRDELVEFVAPFSMSMQGIPPGSLSPASVQRTLDADLRKIRAMTRNLEADLDRFQDVFFFKQSLRDYRIDALQDIEEAMPRELRVGRRRRGKGRKHSR